MRTLGIACTLCCLLPGLSVSAKGSGAKPFQPEQYRYSIEYHWGIIWKKAAEAVLTLDTVRRNDRPLYRARLVAWTAPFADRIFRVRDTLFVDMERKSYRPLTYAKITNEDNVYRKDLHRYDYRGKQTTNKAILYRPHRNAIDTATHTISEEIGLDMMSLFFYLRTLDFGNTPMRHRFNVKIFSGSKVEHLSIEFLGRTLYQQKGLKPIGAYKLGLRFALQEGGKETDSITALVSDDERRFPLYMEGKLPIGSLKVFYTGR